MAQVSPAGEPDQALAHHFIRMFGRRPTPEERAFYEPMPLRSGWCWSSRARRRAALVIARWGRAAETDGG